MDELRKRPKAETNEKETTYSATAAATNLPMTDDTRSLQAICGTAILETVIAQTRHVGLEERIAALESVVTFLVSRISEDQKRPIKPELEQLKKSPESAATHDYWPNNPMEW